MLVGMRLKEENYAHHWGTEAEKKKAGANVRDAFYLNSTRWKRNVVRRGLKVMFEVFSTLACFPQLVKFCKQVINYLASRQ